MTVTPATGKDPTKATPDTMDLGPCILVVNETTEDICGEDAVTMVLVRNDFGLFSATLCTQHTRQHKAYYEVLNRQRPGRRGRQRK